MNKRHSWVEDPLVLDQLAGAENLLVAVLGNGGVPLPFHRQALSMRSKRLRPLLVLLAARCGPESPEPLLLRAAVALELVHEATLYHDDIVDEASVRRGEASVQATFGPSVAGLAGSELLYAATELCVDFPFPLRRALTRAGVALSHGQTQEVATQGHVPITEHERLRIMRLKTARLFALAAQLGVTLASAADDVVLRVTRLGMRIGMCFQLVDDVRDLVGTEATLGRPPGADLRDGVYTLPVIYALSGPPTEERRNLIATLHSLLTNDDPRTMESAIELIRIQGGFARAAATFGDWLAKARKDLSSLAGSGPDDAIRSLENLTTWLTRESLLPVSDPMMGRHSYAGEESMS